MARGARRRLLFYVKTISRVLFHPPFTAGIPVIYLAVTSQLQSSSLPITKVRIALCVVLRQHLVTYLALQPVRFAMQSLSLTTRWSLTPPFHPYPARRRGGIFSAALSVNPTLYQVSYPLGSTASCVARTFLILPEGRKRQAVFTATKVMNIA